MLTNLRQTVTQVITHLEVRTQPQQVATAEGTEVEQLAATGTDDARPAITARPAPPPRPALAAAATAPGGGRSESWGKVGRNAACPCGSGKKYKHCHGRLH
jgi:preprotein translocase subunit SecA